MDRETLAKSISTVGSKLRDLKADPNSDKAEISSLVDELLKLKVDMKVITDKEDAERKAKAEFRAGLEDLLVRKFFYVPSFEIYGGVAGLYDYGPPGCAVMANLQAFWRQHFVLTESMLEVSCASMTPEIVLKTSGHVERFTDFMVQDQVTNEYYRADKLVEERMEELLAADTKADPARTAKLVHTANNAGSFTKAELAAAMAEFEIKSPAGNPVGELTTFNLMFKSDIGPTGKLVGYLRPETAQGIFVNFRRLYEYNSKRLPFAAAQIGLAYRNEIAPRAGLLRVREFPLAEIEHFVNPDSKDHVRFADVADYKLDLLPKHLQVGENKTISMTAREAVYPSSSTSSGAENEHKGRTIDNETLAYFMCRTHMFMVACGVDPARLRFRQHKDTEMAHYAKDCWDCEVLTTYGWIEVVGHADRSAYDLKVHSNSSKVDLRAQEPLDTPRIAKKLVAKPNLGSLGRTFREEAKEILSLLQNADQCDLQEFQKELSSSGVMKLKLTKREVTIEAKDIKIEEVEEKQFSVSFLPSVIEPSFGLGRIIYSILEHSYYVRPGSEQRKVLRLTPVMAPVKLGLYNVVSNIAYQPVFDRIRRMAIAAGVTINEDSSKAMIGRKYSRGDEIGIPFAISVFSDSVEGSQGVVTIRERDSMRQILVPIDDAVDIVDRICRGRTTWDDVYATATKYNIKEDESNE